MRPTVYSYASEMAGAGRPATWVCDSLLTKTKQSGAAPLSDGAVGLITGEIGMLRMRKWPSEVFAVLGKMLRGGVWP